MAISKKTLRELAARIKAGLVNKDKVPEILDDLPDDPSRRKFLKQAGMAGAGAAVLPNIPKGLIPAIGVDDPIENVVRELKRGIAEKDPSVFGMFEGDYKGIEYDPGLEDFFKEGILSSEGINKDQFGRILDDGSVNEFGFSQGDYGKLNSLYNKYFDKTDPLEWGGNKRFLTQDQIKKIGEKFDGNDMLMQHDSYLDDVFLEGRKQLPSESTQEYLERVIADPNSEWDYDIADAQLQKILEPEKAEDIAQFWNKYKTQLPEERLRDEEFVKATEDIYKESSLDGTSRKIGWDSQDTPTTIRQEVTLDRGPKPSPASSPTPPDKQVVDQLDGIIGSDDPWDLGLYQDIYDEDLLDAEFSGGSGAFNDEMFPGGDWVEKSPEIDDISLTKAERAEAGGWDIKDPWYHVTDKEFDEFNMSPWPHLGTGQAALDRYADKFTGGRKAKFKPFTTRSKNPLRATDIGEWENEGTVLEEMITSLGESNPDSEAIPKLKALHEEWFNSDDTFDRDVFDEVRQILVDDGYDSVVYENMFEDAGKDSIIPLKGEDIRSIDAEFDPRYFGDPGLMRGAAAGAVGLGAATQSDDSEAIFIGPNARRFSNEALEAAYRMKSRGKTPEEVWSETAYQYNKPTYLDWPDGIPRQEIDDSLLKINPKSEMSMTDPNTGNVMTPFSEYYIHPELMDNYPQFKADEFGQSQINTRVLEQDYPGRTRGSLDSGWGLDAFMEMGVQNDAPDWEKRSILTHEMQHGIQELEGMYTGSSPGAFTQDHRRYGEIVRELEYEMGALDRRYKQAVAKGDTERARIFQNQAGQLLRRWEAATETHKKADPFKRYETVAGEAEARLADRRMDLLPFQRGQVFPFKEHVGDGMNVGQLDVPFDDLHEVGRGRGPQLGGKQYGIKQIPVKKNVPDDPAPEKPFSLYGSPYYMGALVGAKTRASTKDPRDFQEIHGTPEESVQDRLLPGTGVLPPDSPISVASGYGNKYPAVGDMAAKLAARGERYGMLDPTASTAELMRDWSSGEDTHWMNLLFAPMEMADPMTWGMLGNTFIFDREEAR